MSRISSKAVAAGLCAALVLGGCDDSEDQGEENNGEITATEETVKEPDHSVLAAEIADGCIFYTNALRKADRDHLSGPATVSHAEMAAAAAQAILDHTYGHIGIIPETGELDPSIVTYADEEENEISSLRFENGYVIPYHAPADSLEDYTSQCTYLIQTAVPVATWTDIPPFRLFEYALDGAIRASRDPHSRYEWSEVSDNTKASTRGEFGGLGVQVTSSGGLVKVVSPLPDTPAANAGLQIDDLITHVDGESVRGKTLNEAVAVMRGAVGAPVVLTIQRGDQEPFDVRIVRDLIVVHAVEGRLVGEDLNTAHVRVKTFSEKTQIELEETFRRLAAEAAADGTPLKEIVVDFRNNPGGLLNQAVSVADSFLSAEERIVATGTAPDQLEDQYFAEYVRNGFKGKLQDEIPGVVVKVLQNGGSASASEIVAGALKDAGTPVYGQPTFGKGSVQTLMPIDDQGESAMLFGSIGFLALTTEYFFVGSGLSNQGSGIIPTVKVEFNDFRDSDNATRRKESDLPGYLAPSGMTRAGVTPEEICSLKAEFSGALTDEQVAALPEWLVISHSHIVTEEKDGEEVNKSQTDKMVDAELACAMEDRTYTDKKPFTPPAP